MKKVIISVAMASIVAIAGNEAAAQNPQATETTAKTGELKVRITGIREARGIVLVALGDYTKTAPDGWVGGMAAAGDAENGSIECTLTGDIDPDATIYAFLDTNGNRDLDRNERGIPVEGCAFGPVVLDENGIAKLELKYFD